MWFFNREYYGESSRELEMSTVDRINPNTDFTLEKALMSHDVPEKTHRKEFCSERKLKQELALYAFYNDICPVFDPNWKKMGIYSAGKQNDKWFADMDYLGNEDDSIKVKFGSADEAFQTLVKCVDTTAVMKACEPLHLYGEKDFRKHNMYKPHRHLSKAINCLEENGVEISKKDRKNLRQGINALEPMLGTWFDNDIWPGQFFDGQKVDEDKSIWTKGFFDLPHLIEYTSALNDKQREALKERFFFNYNDAVDKFNSYVKSCNADTKSTVLGLMDKYLDSSDKLVSKIRKKIIKKDPKTFDQYLGMLNKGKLRGNIYAIDSHINNLVERNHMSRNEFELMYQSGKLLRCLSSFANHQEKTKKYGEDTMDGIYYRISAPDQLEKAIDAARELKEYAKSDSELSHVIGSMKLALHRAYRKMYGSNKERKQNAQLVASPMPLDYAVIRAAA